MNPTETALRLMDADQLYGPHKGRRFPVLRRSRWTIDVRTLMIESGTVTVTIQGSATGNSEDWNDLHVATAQSSAAVETLRTFDYEDTPADFELSDLNRYIRAVAATAPGNERHVLEVEAVARFLDPRVPAELDLLPQELREYEDGLERLTRDAEEMVTGLFRGQADPEGDFHAFWWGAGFVPALRRMIALQASHLFETYRVRRKAKNAYETAKGHGLPGIHPEVEAWAMDLSRELTPWVGR